MTLKELKEYLNTYGEEYDNLEVIIEDSGWGFCPTNEFEMGLCENENGTVTCFVIGSV